jgi:hypothetical protein
MLKLQGYSPCPVNLMILTYMFSSNNTSDSWFCFKW